MTASATRSEAIQSYCLLSALIRSFLRHHTQETMTLSSAPPNLQGEDERSTAAADEKQAKSYELALEDAGRALDAC